MQHYLAPIENGLALLSEQDAHHLLRVKRAELGEEIEISDGGRTFLCRVASLSPLRIEVLSSREEDRELPGRMTLCFALLKADHNELIVQKGTEMGVSRFVPFLSSRVIVKPQGAKDAKWARLEKIAHESAKQCRRANLPELSAYLRYEEALNEEADLKFFAYEDEAIHGKSLGNALREFPSLQGKRVSVLIGPEGGFSAKEARLAIEAGYLPVSLGKRILRAETAAMFACALISEAMEGGR